MSQMISVASGFQYSVNIGFDLNNDDKIRDFIPTQASLDLLEDILSSTSVSSTERARVLIGAYGKGKSHVVLMILSMLMKRDRSLFSRVYSAVSENPRLLQLLENYYESKEKILPVVITGSNTSLKVPFITVNFTKRFTVEAFEFWYAHQTKYKKVEDKNVKLEEATMRMPEMARLLGVPRGTVYSILSRNDCNIETVVIGDRRRVVKKSFYEWYKNQDRYHLVGDDVPVSIEQESNPQIELMRRDTFHMDGSTKNIGNEENLTIREAALLADVNPATISKWVKSGRISSVKYGSMIRIPREAFEEWLYKQ